METTTNTFRVDVNDDNSSANEARDLVDDNNVDDEDDNGYSCREYIYIDNKSDDGCSGKSVNKNGNLNEGALDSTFIVAQDKWDEAGGDSVKDRKKYAEDRVTHT